MSHNIIDINHFQAYDFIRTLGGGIKKFRTTNIDAPASA